MYSKIIYLTIGLLILGTIIFLPVYQYNESMKMLNKKIIMYYQATTLKEIGKDLSQKVYPYKIQISLDKKIEDLKFDFCVSEETELFVVLQHFKKCGLNIVVSGRNIQIQFDGQDGFFWYSINDFYDLSTGETVQFGYFKMISKFWLNL